MSDIFERIRNGAYENRLPWGSEAPSVTDDMTVRQVREMKEAAVHNRTVRRNAYHAEDARLRDLFRHDLEKEFGTQGTPKTDLLFSMAWEDGHSEGYESVARRYEQLSALVRP